MKNEYERAFASHCLGTAYLFSGESVTITYCCHVCGSTNIVRNGTNRCGNQQYHCKDCGAYRVLEPQRIHTEEERETILRAYKERASMRGLERVFYVTRQTVARWIMEVYLLNKPG